VERVGFAGAFSFKYSPRPGTPAAGMGDQVPEAVKSERLTALQGLLDAQKTAFDRACLGKSFEILIEKAGRFPGQLIGRSHYLQSVVVNGPREAIGTLANVVVNEVGTRNMTGDILDGEFFRDGAYVAATAALSFQNGGFIGHSEKVEA